MTITDEMLYESAPRAAELFLASLPDRESCGHVFSRRFEAKMRLVPAGKKRMWKRALLIAAVLAALLCISVGAIREAVFQVFRSETETSGTRYAFRTMDELGAFQPMRLGYLPEGYEQTGEYRKETETYTRYILTFENGAGGKFYAEQQMTDRLDMGFGDRSDYTLEHPEIHGAEADLYHSEETGDTLMLWTEKEYVMGISGALSKEEAVRIAEHITWDQERGN